MGKALGAVDSHGEAKSRSALRYRVAANVELVVKERGAEHLRDWIRA